MNYKDNTAAKNTGSMKKLTFTDDWMFGMVMQDKEICKELLERILPEEKFSRIQLVGADGTFADAPQQRDQNTEQSIQSAISNQIQAALKFDKDHHGVRFDAYIKGEDAWAEIEMQVHTGDHLGKRARYYCANMDVDMLMAGKDYRDLKKGYVIFLCTYDYMEKGEPVYFFQRYDVKNSLPFKDESYILILNTSCAPEKVPAHLKALYAYVSDPDKKVEDDLIQKIDDKVEKYNGSEWRWMHVTFEEHVKHMEYLAREEGRLEGEKIGRLEGEKVGREVGRLEGQKAGEQQGDTKARREIASKLKAAGMKPEEIAAATELSLEEIDQL